MTGIFRLLELWRHDHGQHHAQLAPRRRVKFNFYHVFCEFVNNLVIICRLAQLVKLFLVLSICGNYAM